MSRSKLLFLKFVDRLLSGLLFLLKFVPHKKNMNKLPESIAVIKLSAMGDALCLMPSVREIKKMFPRARVTWITTKRVPVGLFEGCSLVDKIIVLGLSPSCISRVLKAVFEGVDVCFDFDQYYRLSELLSFLISRGRTVGFRTSLKGKTFLIPSDYEDKVNEKILFSKLVEKAFGNPVTVNSKIPELLVDYNPSRKVKAFLRRHTSKKIFIYPGSSKNASFRRWSLSKYLRVADKIRDRFTEFEPIFVGGPDELDIKQKVNKKNHTEIINMFDLKGMLYLFTHGQLFIGNDAGLLHLAEAAGLKSISIFGPNVSSKWGSLLPGSSAVEVSLNCRPCLRQYQGIVPKNCKLGAPKCLNSISEDMVFDQVVESLSHCSDSHERFC